MGWASYRRWPPTSLRDSPDHLNIGASCCWVDAGVPCWVEVRRAPCWQRKPTGGRALKGVTTAVSPSVLALRSEQGRDFFPRVATQQEKGRNTSSSARTKPGEGGQQGALRTSTQHGTPPSTQQQLAPMLRWSGESRNEVGGQRR